jgi:hypothetical protein
VSLPRPPVTRLLAPRRHRAFLPTLILLTGVVVLAVIVVVVVVNVRDDDATVDETLHAVGATVRTGDFDVSVDGIQEPYTTEPLPVALAPGERLLVVEVSMRNIHDDRDLQVSSITQFELTDAKGVAAERVVIPGLETIDGAITRSETRHGAIAYRVRDPFVRPYTMKVMGAVGAGGVRFEIK